MDEENALRAMLATTAHDGPRQTASGACGPAARSGGKPPLRAAPLGGSRRSAVPALAVVRPGGLDEDLQLKIAVDVFPIGTIVVATVAGYGSWVSVPGRLDRAGTLGSHRREALTA